jgi:hypothetical protein
MLHTANVCKPGLVLNLPLEKGMVNYADDCDYNAA